MEFECKGCYMPAESISEALEAIHLLATDEHYYHVISGLCRAAASLYHIDSIIPLYHHLAKGEYGS